MMPSPTNPIFIAVLRKKVVVQEKPGRRARQLRANARERARASVVRIGCRSSRLSSYRLSFGSAAILVVECLRGHAKHAEIAAHGDVSGPHVHIAPRVRFDRRERTDRLARGL